MADYVRKPQLMIKRGMNVTLPGDRLAPEYFQYARNVRCYKVGEWRQRGGTTLLYPTTGESVYYLSRMNNNVDGTFRRFVGTNAGKIYVDNSLHTTLSLVDSGYSATDFSSVISRPDRSPLPYLFLGNGSRQSKLSTTGVRTEWGLAAPLTAPDPSLGGRLFSSIEPLAAAFSAVNGALSDQTRVSTTVTYFLADGTLPSMMSIVPAAMSENIREGMFVTVNGTTEIVEQVFQPILDTQIDAIAYDSGVTGPCTIQLSTTTTGLVKDTLVRLNGTENVRVLSVTDGLDGLPSFRCSTSGTFSAGHTVQGLRSFRCFRSNPVAIGNTITAGFVQLVVSAAGIASMTLSFSPGTFDLASAGNRPMQPEDLIHVSLRVSDFSVINEIQIQFDCDSSTNDFTRNYFFKSVRQPDFQAAISQSSPSIQAQQTGISRTQIDEFARAKLEQERDTLLLTGLALGDIDRARVDEINRLLGSGLEIGQDQGPLSGEGISGGQQWTELFIPISEFQRVGSDLTRGWANIVAFRISVNTTGTPTIGNSGFWGGGTYGPNTVELPGYTYVCRARNSSTGSRSNPSPPTRSPILPKRQFVQMNAPSYSDSQADVFDFYRIGGTLGNFHYVGSTKAGSQFTDTIPDSLARRNPLIEVDRFKPWPRSDLPKSGICNVVGTRVTRVSGDTFNTAWVRGTQILIGDRVYSLYTNPSSTTTLDLNESGGNQPGVPFQIPDPQLDGQPMPAVFGPFSGAFGEFLFGCGDPTNPGYLYWTNANDPESASDVNALELCGPSEKLMNGVVLDGIVYCFSDRKSWRILPSFQGGQTGAGSDFYPQETSMGKGLAGRFGICVGDAIYFVSFDGIYRSRGDSLESLTDDSMAPLFDRDGTFITDFITPVSAIDFGSPDDISLTYSFDGIYFTYKGRDGAFNTYYYGFLTKGWVQDTIATGQITRSLREVRTQDADNVIVGTSGGKVMIRSNSVFLDDADSISCRVWDREEIWDDLRSTKQVGDLMVDIDPAGATIIPTLRFENNTSLDVLSSITGSGRDQYVRDVNNGSGRIVRGAALDLTWSNGTGGVPRVYAWEPAALVKSEESADRATDWDNAGYPGTKWLQGFRLRGDTLGVAKSFQVEIDGSAVSIQGFTFTANGEQVQTFSLTNPVVAHEFRIRGTDGDPWRNMGVEWIWEPEPEQAFTWETQVTSLDLPFYSHIREMMVAHRSTADITMSVITDGVTNNYVVPHGSGTRVRSYLPVLAVKAKYHKFRFTSSAPFGIWINDIEVKAGAWGRSDPYNTIKPFGDVSRSNGGAKV